MSIESEINSLISELRTNRIRGKERVLRFLEERKLPFENVIQFFLKLQDNHLDEYSFTINSWISENLKMVIERHPESLLSILESYAARVPDYIVSILQDLSKIDTEKLINMYNLTRNSKIEELRISSGLFLGEIGIRNCEFLFREIANVSNNSDNARKIACINAIRISSNKHRNNNFLPQVKAIEFVINCTKSPNDKLSKEAIFTSVILFEYDHNFRNVLQEYFSQSPENRIYLYRCMRYEDLNDQEMELSMLAKAGGSNYAEEINQALSTIKAKLLRSKLPINRKLDRKRLQKFGLDFTHKLLKRNNPQISYVDMELLSEVGDIDIRFASEYLRKWVLDEKIESKMHHIFYPKVVYSVFKNHEDELIEFIENLTTFGSKFDILIDKIMSEMMFDLRLKFDYELEVHNNTIARDIKNLLKEKGLESELATLYALDLNGLFDKISKSLEIICLSQVRETDKDYQILEYQKKELHGKLEFLKRKDSLVRKCLQILEKISQKRNINYERLTENFRSQKILDVMRKCEILRNEVLKLRIENLDYGQLQSKLKFFANIEKFLGYDWLQKTHTQGHPYHLILTWLSKLVEPDELDSLMQDFKNEKDHHERSQKMGRLMAITRPLGWLLHVNQCLNYFDAKNKQGKGIVISGLKDRRNFFQFLSQLEIAWKLKQHGFVVDLEVPTNTKKRIDIVVSKDGLTIDLELATLDMYADLRHSYFATDVPDRAKTIMLDKISNQISYYVKERSNPIILILNLTHAPDADLYGIVYALHGGGVDNIVTKHGSRIVNRFATFERDPDFLELKEGKKISALMHYKNDINGIGMKMKLLGDIIPNDSAEMKLNEKTIAEVKSALFD